MVRIRIGSATFGLAVPIDAEDERMSSGNVQKQGKQEEGKHNAQSRRKARTEGKKV